MASSTKKLDLAQRIAEALNRTTEPTVPASSFDGNDGGEVIGSVPLHLRHLHNLLVEMGHELLEAQREFRSKEARMDMVRDIFFDSLKMNVSEPENCSGMLLLKNWDVVARFHSTDDEEAGGNIDVLLSALGLRRK